MPLVPPVRLRVVHDTQRHDWSPRLSPHDSRAGLFARSRDQAGAFTVDWRWPDNCMFVLL
jgi:hypothetical protein